jgi:HlyD family secretion protein
MLAFLCGLPVLAGLGFCAPAQPLATGYVEGEYVLIAPVETGRIDVMHKRRGDRVARGELLVQMETTDAEIAIQEAVASLDQAKSQLANLKQGRRPEELAVIEASQTAAKAQAEEAQRVYARQADLLHRGVAAQAGYDQARTALDKANADVNQTSANLEVARLPARPMEIEAGEAQVKQAEARLADAKWRLDHRELRAPAAGSVEDIIRREGEVAGPSQPALSLLPDGAIKLRLYATETLVAGLHPGSEISIRCDGCGPGLTAKVSYISDSPEFTPPVIYSLENRQKLVYLVEARPDKGAERLKPGQIVDAIFPGSAK